MKLYEITAEMEEILENLDQYVNEDGELDVDIAEQLDSLQDSLEKKAESIAAYARKLKDEKDIVANRVKELNKHKSSLSKKSKWLDNYLMSSMKIANIKKIESGVDKISITENAKVDIFDEEAIPEEYKVRSMNISMPATEYDKIKKVLEEVSCDVTESVKILKTDIKNAIKKEGKEVPGAKLIDTLKLNRKNFSF